MIRRERCFAKMDGEFVVFLIGMRINSFWKIHRWWPVGRAMSRMLEELKAHPQMGFLGGEMWGGRSPVLVQYWRSTKHLYAYAKNTQAEHLPAWRAFNLTAAAGDVGIWHETYAVAPGAYENMYVNMPPFGLGKIGALTPVTAGFNTAENRLRSSGDKS